MKRVLRRPERNKGNKPEWKQDSMDVEVRVDPWGLFKWLPYSENSTRKWIS
jgi:hypothetical protein